MTFQPVPGTRDGSRLPTELTSFVGRRRQVAEAKRLLSDARLLTLTGPGGVGKTRLALRVADAARRSFRDGVRFVELAELRDPSLLAYTAAQQLGLQDQPSHPAVDTITAFLESRQLLLVVDNCEHLIHDSALFVDRILRTCPEVRILATSRQSLGIYGETTLVVPPMSVPGSGDDVPGVLKQYDSVQLFADRAKAVLPEFDMHDENCAALARLCRELDGIPLAIELAAVWLRALSLEQIEERLSERYGLLTAGPRGAPPRQQSLRAMVDWSYDLCSTPEERIWARASVFSGGFDLAAVEHVSGGDGVNPQDVPGTIRSLVDKSVLMRDEADGVVRYRMLETMREYGLERLRAAGEDTAVRRRHRDWYAGLLDRFEAEWIGPEQETWVRRLRREHANLRVALDFCITEPGEALVALRMATKIDEYWSIRGINTEARYWLDQALGASAEPTPERVSALCLNAWYGLLQGDFDAAAPRLAEADRLASQLGGTGRTAFVTLINGMAALFTGMLEDAASLLGDALCGFRSAKAARGELFAMGMLGLALGLGGERRRGLAQIDECLAEASERGEAFWRSWALWALAFLEVDHDARRAETAAKEALNIHVRMRNKGGAAFVIDTLAWVNAQQARHERAATLFGAAAALWDAIGSSPDHYAPMKDIRHQYMDRTRAAIGDKTYDLAFRRGYRISAEEAVNYALESTPPTRTATPTGATPTGEEESRLTPREREIAALVAEGLSNKDIASRLVIAPRTAEAHVEHILSKLGFTSRAQVASWFTARNPAAPEAG
ncbi:LuxR C-terminal-related transcriptional regulator [Streptomyces sp. NPDC047108]|uniref:ATP-binding protein n=1 Tax=Streptomyces sp. NPDC047108 TaxID=3155025 RepID=UPI003404605D